MTDPPYTRSVPALEFVHDMPWDAEALRRLERKKGCSEDMLWFRKVDPGKMHVSPVWGRAFAGWRRGLPRATPACAQHAFLMKEGVIDHWCALASRGRHRALFAAMGQQRDLLGGEDWVRYGVHCAVRSAIRAGAAETLGKLVAHFADLTLTPGEVLWMHRDFSLVAARARTDSPAWVAWVNVARVVRILRALLTSRLRPSVVRHLTTSSAGGYFWRGLEGQYMELDQYLANLVAVTGAEQRWSPTRACWVTAVVLCPIGIL